MDKTTQIYLLFLIGCIGTRSLFVYLAKNASKQILQYMGYIALVISIGFFTIYFTGSRKTGLGAFGEKIWWTNLRPIHGSLYLLFAYNAIKGNSSIAWIFLLIDVIIALVSFLNQHFTPFLI